MTLPPLTPAQCSKEMEHILRLARRDGDEWVRLFAGILAPFPHSQTINADVCLEDTMEGMVEEISDACTCSDCYSSVLVCLLNTCS